jgi:hypothetical protein
MARLNWPDILFPHLLAYLSVEDCFRLRSTCSLALQLVDEYFASVKVLDLRNRRNLSVEAFKVNLKNGAETSPKPLCSVFRMSSPFTVG